MSSPTDAASQNRTLHFLGRLAERRARVQISTRGRPQRYSSAVLAVHQDAAQLTLDELIPRTENDITVAGIDWRISGRDAGVEFSFVVPVMAIGVADGVPYYLLALPRTIRHRQRRASHRATLRGAIQATLTLEPAGEPQSSAPLQDLSLGGCALRVKSSVQPPLGSVSDCTLTLPDQEPIRCRFEPLHVIARGPSEWLVGGRYLNLDRREQRRLARFISTLEREVARMQPR